MEHRNNIDAPVPGSAPKTKSQPAQAVVIWKGGARERADDVFFAIDIERRRSKRTLLRRGAANGVEPVRNFFRGILSPLCLPFHHSGLQRLLYYMISPKKSNHTAPLPPMPHIVWVTGSLSNPTFSGGSYVPFELSLGRLHCVTAIIGVLAAAAGGLLYAFVSLPDLLYAVIAMWPSRRRSSVCRLMAVLFCLLRSHRLREFLCACGADHRSRHDPLLAAAARTRDLLCRRQLGECPQRLLFALAFGFLSR